jgi:hypothetical protein
LGVDSFGLEGNQALLWNNYTRALRLGHIRIIDRDDELVWQKAPHGIYTPKLGYIALNVQIMHRDQNWWWRGLWKSKCPQKDNIFMWCIIYNKIPIWDNMRKRNIAGPGWCPLCKGANESCLHLFINCPFTQRVWEEIALRLNQL